MVRGAGLVADSAGIAVLRRSHVGRESVEFHPTEALMQTMEVVTRNMEAAG